VDAAALTLAAGAAALVVDEDCSWSLEGGALAVVENVEVFLEVERILPNIDAAIFYYGRLSKRLLRWLRGSALRHVSIVHLPDYDPVGLSEFMRLRGACPRASLHVPSELERLVVQHGNGALMRRPGSVALWPAVRRSSDETVLRVAEILDRHSLGLESQALLLDAFVDDIAADPGPGPQQ
jgi:hypothetical protein